MTTRTLRAYAVGAAFSVRDVPDDWQWRPTDIWWTDVEYRRPRTAPEPRSNNRPRRAPAPVRTRIDPSRIRTPAQQKAVGRTVC